VVHYAYTDGVVNGNAAILSFPLTSTGIAVTPTVAATAGTADIIRALRSDGQGKLYALTFQDANFSEIGVYVYGITDGELALERSFTSSAPFYADGFTVSTSGDVYVSMQDGLAITFPPTASGIQPAYTELDLAQYGFAAMATDSSGNIYGLEGDQVNEYDPGFADTTPIRDFSVPNQINDDPDVTVGADGTLYAWGCVLNTKCPEILEFAAGSATVTNTLNLSGTIDSIGGAIGLDESTGLLWVDSFGQISNSRVFDAFPTDASGTLAPSKSFTAVSTDFQGTWVPAMAIY